MFGAHHSIMQVVHGMVLTEQLEACQDGSFPLVTRCDRNRGTARCANTGTPGHTGAAIPTIKCAPCLCPGDTALSAEGWAALFARCGSVEL